MDEFSVALHAYQRGDLRGARQMCLKLLSQRPKDDRLLFLLGLIAHGFGENQSAVELMGQAIQINPLVAGYHANVAHVLTTLGRNVDAIAAATAALRLQPNYANALLNLGNALLAKGQTQEAVEAYRKTIQIPPAAGEAAGLGAQFKARNNLGRALHILGQLDEAIAVLQELSQLYPNVPEFRVNLANALKDQGRIEQALVEYRAAAGAAPHDARIGSALLYALWFDPAAAPRDILNEHLAWSRRHADPLRDPRPHENEPDPARRLRLGYVSPDFRGHVSGYLIEPILANHDHEQFEIFCYSNTARPDDLTDRLHGYADVWRETRHLSDEAMAERIRSDRIDILVDITSHMDGNRALVFARKPVPVQVNYLAYPATSGMSVMDYRITCEALDPDDGANDANTNSERLIRVPSTFWCYGASPTSPPVNERMPQRDTFTFGSLNAFGKVNEQVVTLWCEILRAVPQAQLMILLHGGLQGNSHVAARFERHGISPSRLRFVELRPRDPYLAHYHDVDLSLDPFPYNGHTTSLDSLWMGVPFVTLAGTAPISRAGACILANVGLTDFVAPTKERYVELCVELANDPFRLAALRRELRDRMRNSPLMDSVSFTRNLEAAYRCMWREYVVSKK